MDLEHNKIQELQKERIKEEEVRFKKYLGLLHRVFNTDEGKELLKAWEKAYFYSPTYNEKNSDPEIYLREGENRFLRKILTNLNYYQNLAEKGELL